jgi:hypothetical protein
MRFNTLHHTSQKASKLLTELPKYSKPRSFPGGGELRPLPGPYLDPLENLSGPQTPDRLSSPHLTQTPGSAPDIDPHANRQGTMISIILIRLVPWLLIPNCPLNVTDMKGISNSRPSDLQTLWVQHKTLITNYISTRPTIFLK